MPLTWPALAASADRNTLSSRPGVGTVPRIGRAAGLTVAALAVLVACGRSGPTETAATTVARDVVTASTALAARPSSTSAATAPATSATAGGPGTTAAEVAAAPKPSPLPDVTVRNAATGQPVALAAQLPADRPLLVWFWAPH